MPANCIFILCLKISVEYAFFYHLKQKLNYSFIISVSYFFFLEAIPFGRVD